MPSHVIEMSTVKTDVLVVGGGGAASRAALSARLAGANVRMACKAPLLRGGSTVHGASEIMSMGAAAGFGDVNDSPEIHYQDTMRAAQGFIDPELVRVLAEEAPKRVHDLTDIGVKLDKNSPSDVKLIQSDFGSYARCVGVSGKTGKAFVTAINSELKRLGVFIDAPMSLVDLVRDSEGRIAGAVCYDNENHTFVHYQASSVILGTGGMHGAFSQQVSTPEMTGDGQAICYRHGAELVNLEFHQFGPALVHPYVQLFSKSCFVLHPKIKNKLGEEFLPSYLPSGVTLSDVLDEKVFPFTTSNLSRYLDIAIAREVNEGRGSTHGGVYFSFDHVPDELMNTTIPNTARWMSSKGVDLKKDHVEVGIAFQCMNGGVRMTNADAESSIPGLYVIGEVAGGVRGPDRPGGNSLAEGQVFGHRAGQAAARNAHHKEPGDATTLADTKAYLKSILNRSTMSADDIMSFESQLRDLMQRYCLVEKSHVGLDYALTEINKIRASLESGLSVTHDSLVQGLSLRNMADASALVLTACLNRQETRSGHLRTDFPESDDKQYLGAYIWQKVGDRLQSKFHKYPFGD